MSKKPIRPTDIEDAQITAAALTDPDNLPLTDAELKQFKRGRGRPMGSGKKEQVTLRLDAEILEQFKATGNGWQTRINDALRDWAKHH
ncbi:MAG: BrnA antitoxin family protein [Betaproteobacteria bacterium]|nr:BrnA antitoxin family protein [Betaproteobacteria bacterium]